MYLSKRKTAKTKAISNSLGYDTTTISDAIVVLRKKGLVNSKKLKDVKTGFPALTHNITTKGRAYIREHKLMWSKIESSLNKRKKKVISKKR